MIPKVTKQAMPPNVTRDVVTWRSSDQLGFPESYCDWHHSLAEDRLCFLADHYDFDVEFEELVNVSDSAIGTSLGVTHGPRMLCVRLTTATGTLRRLLWSDWDQEFKLCAKSGARYNILECHFERKRPVKCNCTHLPGHHDLVSDACLRSNPVFGPCPCAATPEGTRKTLERVFEELRAQGTWIDNEAPWPKERPVRPKEQK